MGNFYWPQPDADTRREHRARWLVWVTHAGDFGPVRELVPHTSKMHDPDYREWDAECTCGQWESKTGGAPRPEIQDMLNAHRAEAGVVLKGGGATFPYPLYAKWFAAFSEIDKGVDFDSQRIG